MLDKLRRLGKKALSGVQCPLKALWHILKWFFTRRPIRILIGVGLLLVIYTVYRPPEDIISNIRLLDFLWRLLSWLFGSEVVRSILGLFSLLVCYCIFYWFRIRKGQFIVVSEFQVWGDLAQKFPEKGMTARLRDELMRLWNWMRVGDHLSLSAAASPDEGSSDEQRFERARQVLRDDVSLSLREQKQLLETHVTLQYKGISLEAIHTFVRRITGRELVITGDLMNHLSGLALLARTTDYGPWEVLVENSDSVTLGRGLQRLALRIITDMMQRFKPKLERGYTLLQIKARELKDYDQALILAELSFLAAPDSKKAKRNLGTAHNDIGVELALMERYEEAIAKFEEASKLNPQFKEAHINLGNAYKEVEKKQDRDKALREAERIREKQPKLRS